MDAIIYRLDADFLELHPAVTSEAVEPKAPVGDTSVDWGCALGR